MADKLLENTHHTRGGARPGAGRPKSDSTARVFSFRCSGSLADRLSAQKDRTGFITESLSRSYASEDASSTERDFPAPVGAIPAGRVRPLHLPLFDFRVVAGFPVPLDNDEMSQDIEILSLLCPHPESSYLVRVSGESMIDAGIMNGDIVIVDKSNRSPRPDEIAVCELNGEYTLKHFVEKDGKGWLVPANPDYPRIPVNECDQFSVWGTVTYIIHKARK